MKKFTYILMTILYCHLGFGQSEQLNFVNRPMYLVFDDYTVYQDNSARVIVYPDKESFKVPKNMHPIALDKNGVYYKGKLIKIDTTGLELFGIVPSEIGSKVKGELLWKTNKRIYLGDRWIQEIDANSFERIQNYHTYYKDKNHVYYFIQIVPEAEVNSLVQKVNDDYYYDDNFVYHKGNRISVNGTFVQPVNDELCKTESAVYKYYNSHEEPQKIEGADPQSIKRLSRCYASDNNHLFFYANKRKLDGVSTEMQLRVWDQGASKYYCFRDSIYIGMGEGSPLVGIDATTFSLLQSSDVFYDKSGIYSRHYKYKKGANEAYKIPFNYTSIVDSTNASQSGYFLRYKDQIYDLRFDTLYTNLSEYEVRKIHKEKAAKEQMKYTPDISYNTDVELYPYTNFVVGNDSIYFNETPLISTNEIQLLGVFNGDIRWCGNDSRKSSYIYLFRNERGFWLVESKKDTLPIFIGKKLSEDYNPIFKGFELPKTRS